MVGVCVISAGSSLWGRYERAGKVLVPVYEALTRGEPAAKGGVKARTPPVQASYEVLNGHLADTAAAPAS